MTLEIRRGGGNAAFSGVTPTTHGDPLNLPAYATVAGILEHRDKDFGVRSLFDQYSIWRETILCPLEVHFHDLIQEVGIGNLSCPSIQPVDFTISLTPGRTAGFRVLSILADGGVPGLDNLP